MTGRKYGLLVIPTHRDDDRTLELHPGRSWRGRVADIVDAKRVAHWRTWLGSVEWEEMIEQTHRLVLVTMPSSRPDVLDAENEALSRDLHLIWRALLLAAPLDPVDGKAWSFSGQIDERDVRLLRVHRHGSLGPIATPFYASRETFWERFPGDDPADWLGRWASLITQLRASHASLPDAIRLAVLSFEEAHHQEQIEFRLPTFVRAAEAVLAIPKGGGAKVFSERLRKLAPHLSTHWHLGVPDLASRLESLYQHRNDCVHGKVPFLVLRAKGDAGADEAGWFEHLAEVSAREALLAALGSPALLAAAADRLRLEAAWAAGSVP